MALKFMKTISGIYHVPPAIICICKSEMSYICYNKIFDKLTSHESISVENSQSRNMRTCKLPKICRIGKAFGRQKKTNIKTTKKLFNKVSPVVKSPRNKISVVGAGQVGMACAFAILTQNVANNLVLINRTMKKVEGEMLDLLHGSCFLNGPKIKASSDYAVTAGSKICIVIVGVPRRVDDNRLTMAQRNADIFKNVIPPLVKYSPDTILLIVSNPCDILTYVSWKISGLRRHKVIGTGTSLDTSRFRFYLSERLQTAPSSSHGWIIGEHGDSSVPVWSGVNVGGYLLRDINPYIGTAKDPEKWSVVHDEAVQGGYKVNELKGFTNWAISLNLSSLVNAILNDTNTLHAVSVHADGSYGIEEEVFLSLPCLLGNDGIKGTLTLPLTELEVQRLKHSAQAIFEIQKTLKI